VCPRTAFAVRPDISFDLCAHTAHKILIRLFALQLAALLLSRYTHRNMQILAQHLFTQLRVLLSNLINIANKTVILCIFDLYQSIEPAESALLLSSLVDFEKFSTHMFSKKLFDYYFDN
jgi:hypothetical protein